MLAIIDPEGGEQVRIQHGYEAVELGRVFDATQPTGIGTWFGRIIAGRAVRQIGAEPTSISETTPHTLTGLAARATVEALGAAKLGQGDVDARSHMAATALLSSASVDMVHFDGSLQPLLEFEPPIAA